MGREHRHGMLRISLQVKRLLLISSICRVVYFFGGGGRKCQLFLAYNLPYVPFGCSLRNTAEPSYKIYLSGLCWTWKIRQQFLFAELTCRSTVFTFFLCSSLGAECQSPTDWGGRTLGSLVQAWLLSLCSTRGAALPGTDTMCWARGNVPAVVPSLLGLVSHCFLGSPFLWYSYSQKSEREAYSMEEDWLFQW